MMQSGLLQGAGGAGVPLAKFCVLESERLDDARSRINALVDGQCRLDPLPERQRALNVRFHERVLSRLSFFTLAFGSDCRISHVQSDRYYLSVAYRGTIDHVVDGQPIRVHGAQAVVLDGTQEMTVDYLDDAFEIDVSISREELHRYLGQLLCEELREPLRFSKPLDLGHGHGISLRNAMALFVRELADDDSLLSHNIGITNFEDLLLYTLLQSQPHNYSERLHRPAGGVSACLVQRVERYLDEHAQEPISMDVLTRFSGVPAHTLFAAFRRARDYTPMQYLRSVRLRRVRDELLDPGNWHSVSEVAMKWGFMHLGRFSQYYRQAFGEPPSATRRKHH